MEFSQLIINYPEKTNYVCITSSTPIAVAVLRKMQQILPLLLDENGLSLKIPTKSQVKRLKTQVQNQVKIRVKTQGKGL